MILINSLKKNSMGKLSASHALCIYKCRQKFLLIVLRLTTLGSSVGSFVVATATAAACGAGVANKELTVNQKVFPKERSLIKHT